MSRFASPARVVPLSAPQSLRHPIAAIVGLCACVALGGAQGAAALGRAPGAEPSFAPREVAARMEAPRPGPGFSIQSASPRYGIEGFLQEGGTSIAFMSRQSDQGLLASVVDAKGKILYEYREFKGETIRVEATGGVRIVLPRAPELRVNGLLYGPSAPEQVEAVRALATSREGRLLRRLGLELQMAAPGSELVRERMGLELAAQALWPHFRPDAAAAAYLYTEDYEVNAQGYVVHNQPQDLVLANNYVRSGLPWEKHDDGAVGDCFGRCGQGCTGGFVFWDFWPSTWTDTQGTPVPVQQLVYCVSGEDWVYTWHSVPTTHSVTGTWSPGCQLHDNCCRLNKLLCWTACNAVVPTVPAGFLIDSEDRTWSYTDNQWSVTSYNAGYSGCTCPGYHPYAEDYECIQSGQ